MSEEFLTRLEALAASYTPEWKFSRERPDIGSALAILYGELMEGSGKHYHETWEQHRRLFYTYLKAEPLTGTCASGYLVCGLSSPDMPEAVVNAGMLLTAKNPGGTKQEYRLTENIYVTGIRIASFFEHGGEWYFSFDKAPAGGTIQMLFLAEEAAAAGQSYEFFYESGDGFKELMIQDETCGFSRSGRILFMGSPEYRTVSFMGRDGFFIRIAPREGSRLPRCLPRVYLNAGRVEAVTPGVDGNLSPGAVIKLERTVGFVTKLSNPDPWCMGEEAETEEACMVRYGARVRHQFKAITPKDFERLSLEACPNLYQSKCYPGYLKTGEKSPGQVTVAALQKDYLEGRRYFYKVREQIEAFLSEKAGAGVGRVQVISPWFVWMDVHAVIQADSYQYAMDVKSSGEKALLAYLNPVSGGYNEEGWGIGTIPRALQIRHLLARQPHVRYVHKLCINVWLDRGDGREAIDLDTASALPFILPLSGSHDISITVG